MNKSLSLPIRSVYSRARVFFLLLIPLFHFFSPSFSRSVVFRVDVVVRIFIWNFVSFHLFALILFAFSYLQTIFLRFWQYSFQFFALRSVRLVYVFFSFSLFSFVRFIVRSFRLMYTTIISNIKLCLLMYVHCTHRCGIFKTYLFACVFVKFNSILKWEKEEEADNDDGDDDDGRKK